MLHCEINNATFFFMAKVTYNIDIDGYIGQYYYSKAFVRNELAKHQGKEVYVRINSLGGSLDHGLDICDRFKDHGMVNADLYGMNASAATLATLKCKKVRMSSSGLYLIHKVMNWVDVWGQLNADELEAEIQKLKKNKEENDKIDLVIAQMYAHKTGREASEMLNIMKVGGWLTAQEALSYGFIDEIIPENIKVNLKEVEDKFNAFGLPTNIIGKHNFFSNISNSTPMKVQPKKVNEILNVSQLESTDEGVFLNEEQIHTIDTKVTELSNQVATANTERDNATTAQQAAEANVTTANATISDRDATIVDLNNQIAALRNGAGASTNGVVKATDGGASNEVDEFEQFKSAQSLYNILP